MNNNFDPNTGQPLNNNNTMNNFDPNTGQPINNQVVNQTPVEHPKKKSNKTLFIILGIIGGLFLIFIVLIIAIPIITLRIAKEGSEKLVCKSDLGNITLTYNDEQMLSYVATGGITYDLDGQKAVFKRIGKDQYIIDFENWFKTNTNGTCTEE